MADSPEGPEEQRLRRAFQLIGEEAGRVDAPARRRRPLVVAALAVAAAVCVGVVAVNVLGDSATVSPEGQETGGAGQGQTELEAVSCARVIVQGEITAIEKGKEQGSGEFEQYEESDTVTLTITVQEWIKPGSGDSTVRVTVLDPAYVDPADALTTGTDILIVVPQFVSRPAEIYEGDRIAEERARIVESLPEAENTECPPEWRGTDDTVE
ncbi:MULTISPECIES: hypothetical protein [unclassified Nocardiopsis]|uniref:hypothetical protein n=1 Tax=Nocardiopsis TaxID=2013 RepID=UPI00387B3BAA